MSETHMSSTLFADFLLYLLMSVYCSSWCCIIVLASLHAVALRYLRAHFVLCLTAIAYNARILALNMFFKERALP